MAPPVYYLQMYENLADSVFASPRRAAPVFKKTTPIVLEISALQDALHALRHKGASIERARSSARQSLKTRTPSKLLNPRLNEVIHTSLNKIAGNSLPPRGLRSPSRSSSERHLIETASLAWLGWAEGREPGREARDEARLPRAPNASGALHESALLPWLQAIERLQAEDLPEASRLWKRAIEIGSILGTESHPAILWSYAASFFPHE